MSEEQVSGYTYSPIKTLRIKNFRNIGDITIDFSESPIISLIGENEAGKTSVVKAFSVCALHANPRDQKDYIRDGTQGFGVEITLANGTVVTRLKTVNQNRYTVKKLDEVLLDITKIDSGLPMAVQSVMGLVEEPETKEYLQVRTYEDRLLFVVTPASTNYKVVYSALKVENVTNAIRIGSKEANGLKSQIANNESGIQALTARLRGIYTCDITGLLNIKSRLAKQLDEVRGLRKAVELYRKLSLQKAKFGALSQLFSEQVSTVDEHEVSKIVFISKLLETLYRLNARSVIYSNLDTLEDIDLTEIRKLSDLTDIKYSLIAKKRESMVLEAIKGTDVVNEVEVRTLSKLGRILLSLSDNYNRLRLIDTSGAEEINERELFSLLRSNQLLSDLRFKYNKLRLIDTSGADEVLPVDVGLLNIAQQAVKRYQRQLEIIHIKSQIDDYCNQIEEYLKRLGVAIETCPRCGEEIVIDIDKFGQVSG